jgi:hypothetical protein
VNVTIRILLGNGDGDRTRAGADVEDTTGATPPIYGFESGIHNAFGVGTRDQDMLVELQPQITKVGVPENALNGLASRAT